MMSDPINKLNISVFYLPFMPPGIRVEEDEDYIDVKEVERQVDKEVNKEEEDPGA